MKPVLFDRKRFNACLGPHEVDWPGGKMPPEGWSKHAPDPMKLLAGYPRLRIKHGWVLRAYQFCEGLNGNGFVYAMPVEAEFPEPSELGEEASLFKPPRPSGAADDFMTAVEGDGSADSYVAASQFARAAGGLGAMWHGRGDPGGSILFENLFRVSENREHDQEDDRLLTTDKGDWTLLSRVWPRSFRPRFAVLKAGPTLTFYTYTSINGEHISRYTDVFTGHGCAFDTRSEVLAEGGPGYHLLY